jgi:hypothetical protein
MKRNILLLLSIFFLGGCQSIVGMGQSSFSGRGEVLEPGTTIGQTFFSRQRGLNGVKIYLSPQTQGKGRVRLQVYPQRKTDKPLAVAELAVEDIVSPRFYPFSFSPLKDSSLRDYTLRLELQGSGRVRVGTGPGDSYSEGALYQNEKPQDGQCSFQLLYAPLQMGWGLAGEGLAWLGIMAVAFFLFILPGWALLRVLWPDPLSGGERWGLAGGLSLALYPLLLLWTDLLSRHPGPAFAWVPPLAALVILAWKRRFAGRRRSIPLFKPSDGNTSIYPDLALVVLVGLIFFNRLYGIRSLEVPLWGDSYQHAVIVQLLLDHGGLFNSWLPYAPYESFTIHFGFHTAAALYAWVTGTPAAQATLITGQLINTLSILGLYPLAVHLLGGNRWGGVGAVAMAGLFSPLPAGYVNWGRYAQLAGQAILPVAIWLVWKIMEDASSTESETSGSRSWVGRSGCKKIFLAGIALAGMTLNYYRMPVFALALFLPLFGGWFFHTLRRDKKKGFKLFFPILLIGLIAGLAFLPRGLQIWGGKLGQWIGQGVQTAANLEKIGADYQLWRSLFMFVPAPLIGLAACGLIWGLIKKNRRVLVIGLWIIVLGLIVGGQIIRLPLSNLMQNFAVLIALYIPLSLLIGVFFGQLGEALNRRFGASGNLILFVLLLLLSLGAAWKQREVVRAPDFALVNRPDYRALDWIRTHTSPEARFLVKGAVIHEGRSVVGVDAGWWIPLLAGRENTLPPQYALLTEKPISLGYSQGVVNLVKTLEQYPLTSPSGIKTLTDWGITHVYIGQRQGLSSGWMDQLKSLPEEPTPAPFQLVYRQDRTAIFSFHPPILGKKR